jgi:hypothetical protein
VLPSVLPIAGVIVLYFVEDNLVRIGVIAGITALFSLCLALLTSAKKSEIFAATAAYAIIFAYCIPGRRQISHSFSAVLVVFLGSNN